MLRSPETQPKTEPLDSESKSSSTDMPSKTTGKEGISYDDFYFRFVRWGKLCSAEQAKNLTEEQRALINAYYNSISRGKMKVEFFINLTATQIKRLQISGMPDLIFYADVDINLVVNLTDQQADYFANENIQRLIRAEILEPIDCLNKDLTVLTLPVMKQLINAFLPWGGTHLSEFKLEEVKNYINKLLTLAENQKFYQLLTLPGVINSLTYNISIHQLSGIACRYSDLAFETRFTEQQLDYLLNPQVQKFLTNAYRFNLVLQFNEEIMKHFDALKNYPHNINLITQKIITCNDFLHFTENQRRTMEKMNVGFLICYKNLTVEHALKLSSEEADILEKLESCINRKLISIERALQLSREEANALEKLEYYVSIKLISAEDLLALKIAPEDCRLLTHDLAEPLLRGEISIADALKRKSAQQPSVPKAEDKPTQAEQPRQLSDAQHSENKPQKMNLPREKTKSPGLLSRLFKSGKPKTTITTSRTNVVEEKIENSHTI